MSLHLGIVQVSTVKGPVLTVLFDTTDNERYLRALAHISSNQAISSFVPHVERWLGYELGPQIRTHG